MRNAFRLICEDGHDKITLKSLQKVAKELGENMTNEELQEMINPHPSSNLNMTSSVVKSIFKASKVESVDSCAKPFSKSSWEENFKALVAYKDEHGHINLKTVSDVSLIPLCDKTRYLFLF